MSFDQIFGSDPEAFVARPERERIIVSIDAEQNQGKTHFGGTCPASLRTGSDGLPREGILYQCFDKKSISTIEKFRDGRVDRKKIAIKDYSFTFPLGLGNHCGFGNMCPPTCAKCQMRASIVNPKLTAFHEDFTNALKYARSIVWDHGGAVWEAIRFARFGRNSMIPQLAYGGLNWEFEDLIDRAYESDTNLILLHRLGAEFKEDESPEAAGQSKQSKKRVATGGMERKGAYSKLGFKVQAEVQVKFDVANHYSVGTIATCQSNMMLCGKAIEDFNFFNLALELAPNVDPGAWM